jgi:hypothetical protein
MRVFALNLLLLHLSVGSDGAYVPIDPHCVSRRGIGSATAASFSAFGRTPGGKTRSSIHNIGTPTTALNPGHRLSAVAPTYSGLLGRFRKKRKVDQVPEISTGDGISDIDVEQMTVLEDGTVQNEPTSIRTILGPGKAVLVGEIVIYIGLRVWCSFLLQEHLLFVFFV